MSEQQPSSPVKPNHAIPAAEDDDAQERYRAPALDNGLDILEALAATEMALTQAEIAKALDRSPSEIYRMLDRLVRRGYVVRTDSERYELSLKLFALAHQHAPRRRLVALAMPLMRAFVQATEQSCHLVVFDRGRVIVVAQLDAPGYFGLAIRVGAHIALVGTGSGHVLLAFQTPQERALMLAENEAAADEGLDAHLARLRRRGHELMDSRQSRGVVNIAAPVLGPDGSAIASLSCAYLTHVDPARPDQAATAVALVAAASELTRLTGGDRPHAVPPYKGEDAPSRANKPAGPPVCFPG